MDHVRLYRNELTQLGYGNPVWEPNPDTLYDCIRIGDVGYFQNKKFVLLFNILPQPDDSTQTRHLPFPQPTFPPLSLPDGFPTTHNTNPLEAGVYGLESSLTFSVSVAVVGLAFGNIRIASSSLTQLTVLDQYYKENLLSSSPMRKEQRSFCHMKPIARIHYTTSYSNSTCSNIIAGWYNFATVECQHDIKLHDLILVSGCDLTRRWATATYFQKS